jgi:hypothetical protein
MKNLLACLALLQIAIENTLESLKPYMSNCQGRTVEAINFKVVHLGYVAIANFTLEMLHQPETMTHKITLDTPHECLSLLNILSTRLRSL